MQLGMNSELTPDSHNTWLMYKASCYYYIRRNVH